MKTGALTTFLALCLPVTVFATMMRRAINENDPRDKCGLISLSNTAS